MITMIDMEDILKKEMRVEKMLDKFKLAIHKSKKKKKEIAKDMGISVSYLSNMLSGRGELIKEHRKNLNIILNTNY